MAAQLGVLVKGGDVLERANHLTAIVFDKTGTLTCSRMAVTSVKLFDERVRRPLKADAAQQTHGPRLQLGCPVCIPCGDFPIASGAVLGRTKRGLVLYLSNVHAPRCPSHHASHPFRAWLMQVNKEDALALAAALEVGSDHPIAGAIVVHAQALLAPDSAAPSPMHAQAKVPCLNDTAFVSRLGGSFSGC